MYVELHARSAFSFLEGASSPEELAGACRAHNMPSMALLDRDGLYGSPRFHLAMKKLERKAHIGAEISCGEGGRLSLLAASREGYQNLCRLLTRMKLRSEKGKGAVLLREVRQYSRGLVCLTGGDEGLFDHTLRQYGVKPAAALLGDLCAIFGKENVYVELQRHFRREEERRNQAAVDLARVLDLPLLATNGACHALPEQREILDVFTCLRHHRVLANAGRLLSSNSERYLKSPTQMEALFADLPEAIQNTSELASRLSFTMGDLGYRFPPYPTPDGQPQIDFLRARTREGMLDRYGAGNEKAAAQIERELALIGRLDLAGYFLIVWDIVEYCRVQDILVQGRGSAANSAVCYALGITAVDPVGMELLFERFLSESRGEWPDIDLDLPSGDHREQVIQYIYERYGALGSAMTANVICYRSRSVAREVGKAMGFEDEQIARLSGLVGHWEWRGENDTMASHFGQAGFDIRHPRIAHYLDLCMRIHDLPRHLGQHSGGMVICAGLLNRVVPIERASMPGRTVIQWDKEDCADMGLIKVDLLGLGMLAAVKDSIELITLHYRKHVDIAALPEDTQVYETLRKADTVGMFQVESRAQMASIPHNAPKKFYDLVVQVAIIRPGPIVGQMMHPYMRRRQGKEEVTYPHLSLKPVLERTLGVPLFQEQLLRIAMTVADFSGAEADELRRAVGMRRSWERMKNLEGKLRSGMTKKGIDAKTQDTIVQHISSFALYGFPESHAASFALIAYASAYFKVKYLAAFTAAILNNQPMGFYSPAVLVKDAQRHGLRVKPIDVQVSDWPCTIEHESDGRLSLRIGLSYAKSLTKQSAEALVAARRKDGPFLSADDLTWRVPSLNRRELTRLAQIGAMNQLNGIEHRRDALWQVERAGKLEGPLFQQNSEALHEDSDALPLRKMGIEERLVADYAGTGLTVGKHPMHYRRAELRRNNILSAEELRTRKDGEFVRTAGCIIARQRPGTAKGFIFISMEDETGIANVIVTPDLYERDRLVVTRSKFLLVEGPLQNQDSVIHVKATRLSALSDRSLEVRSHDFH